MQGGRKGFFTQRRNGTTFFFTRRRNFLYRATVQRKSWQSKRCAVAPLRETPICRCVKKPLRRCLK